MAGTCCNITQRASNKGRQLLRGAEGWGTSAPCLPWELTPSHATLRWGQPSAGTWEGCWGHRSAGRQRRDKGRGRGNLLPKRSVPCISCGVGRKGGRQLEGIPMDTDTSRRMEIFAVWSLPHLVSLYPSTILFRVAGAIRAWIWALGSIQTLLNSLSCSGRGKIHKPTRSAGSEQNLLRVPFLLESQARPGEKERGK